MKSIKILSLFLLFLTVSCSSVRVNSDYDKNVNFSQYKTYAFHRSGIDKAEISDLDKKRILRAIDNQLATKGFTKSESPDLLVNIFTKEKERVDIYNSYGWGWGWSPFWGVNYTHPIVTTEGTLYIDLIDAKNKELIWQGMGTGYLTEDTNKKDERINEFVSKIIAEFPPTPK